MEVSSLHIPVLYGELIESLHFFAPGKNIIVDGTLGLGGHASGVIQKLTKGDVFIGLDCDTENLARATERLLEVLKEVPQDKQPTVYCIHSNFRDIAEVLTNIGSYTSINGLNGLNGLT